MFRVLTSFPGREVPKKSLTVLNDGRAYTKTLGPTREDHSSSSLFIAVVLGMYARTLTPQRTAVANKSGGFGFTLHGMVPDFHHQNNEVVVGLKLAILH